MPFKTPWKYNPLLPLFMDANKAKKKKKKPLNKQNCRHWEYNNNNCLRSARINTKSWKEKIIQKDAAKQKSSEARELKLIILHPKIARERERERERKSRFFQEKPKN